MKKLFDKVFLRYCLLGVSNFALCTAIMFILYNTGLCSKDVAPLVNYGLGAVIWYFGNLWLVFPGQKQSVGLVVRFVLEIVLCYVGSYYLLAPAIYRLLMRTSWFPRAVGFLRKMPAERFEANCIMGIGVVLYAVSNYFGQRFYVFRNHKRVKSK